MLTCIASTLLPDYLLSQWPSFWWPTGTTGLHRWAPKKLQRRPGRPEEAVFLAPYILLWERESFLLCFSFPAPTSSKPDHQEVKQGFPKENKIPQHLWSHSSNAYFVQQTSWSWTHLVSPPVHNPPLGLSLLPSIWGMCRWSLELEVSTSIGVSCTWEGK